MTANGCGVSFWGNEDVLKVESGDGCTTLICTLFKIEVELS